MASTKVKIIQKPPQLGSSSVISLPQPPQRNAEEYLKAYVGYIYTAVGAIAQEVASLDLHLYKATFNKTSGPKTAEIFEHPILSTLKYVNQISTWYDLVEATQTYLELVGEAFWVVIKENGEPREIWLLRPDWVKVIPSSTDVISHYNYYAGGVQTEKVEIPKENMIPFKYFNPLNPYRGKGATQAAALPFDILNFAQEYNRNFFFNSAIPSMIFSSEQSITEETAKKFLAQWQSTFGGRSKSNKVAFLGKGLKVDKASIGAKELDFTEQMKGMRDDVLAVFKVPKTVLGLTEDVNRANAEATTRAFMERVITPRMRKFIDTLNEYFVPMFTGDDNSIFLDFTDPAPEDVELKLKKYSNGRQNNWLTPNEIRAEENLEPLPGGDDLFANTANFNNQNNPANMQDDDEEEDDKKPKPSSGNEEDDDPQSKPTDEDKGIRSTLIKLLGGDIKRKAYTSKVMPRRIKHMVNVPVKRSEVLYKETLVARFVEPLKKYIGDLIKQDEYNLQLTKKGKAKKEKDMADLTQSVKSNAWTDETKDAYYKALITQVDSWEDEVEERAQTVFNEQKIMTLAKLAESQKNKNLFSKMGKKARTSDIIPAVKDMNQMWRTVLDMLKEIYIEKGNETLDFLNTGGSVNITTEFASKYLQEYSAELVSQLDDTTRTALKAQLQAGFDEGESMAQLAKRIEEVYDGAGKVRANQIARSEVIKASNEASVEAYRQSGVVVAKEWLTERDKRTCSHCLRMDGKIIPLNNNFFKKGDTFEVNGVTITLGFTNVTVPPLHTDCRCTTIPVLDTTEN